MFQIWNSLVYTLFNAVRLWYRTSICRKPRFFCHLIYTIQTCCSFSAPPILKAIDVLVFFVTAFVFFWVWYRHIAGIVSDQRDFCTLFSSGTLLRHNNLFGIVFDAKASLENQKMALLVVMRGGFLRGIGTLLCNEFWYFLKMKVSFLLFWFFKQSKRVLFLPFFQFLLIFLKKLRG